MDPAHPLLGGETLAVHPRLSGKRGSVWLRRDDAQERNRVRSSHTQTQGGTLMFQHEGEYSGL